jgi:DNA repair protein RadB
MRVSTGSKIIDGLLEGGLDSDTITTIFGPAGSGKTNIVLLTLKKAVEDGKKAVFIDTEGGFSVERLKQLSSSHEKVMENTIVLKPTSFKEQNAAFEKLKKIVNEKIGVIIVDSIAYLYRLESAGEEIQEVNKALGKAIGDLNSIARKMKIPVLITNQVYSLFDDRDKVNMVGGDLLRYGSKCLVELQITPENNRRALLRKHRSLPQKEAVFKIVEKGIEGAKEGKGFKLF